MTKRVGYRQIHEIMIQHHKCTDIDKETKSMMHMKKHYKMHEKLLRKSK